MTAPVTRPSLVLRLRDATDHDAWQTFDTLYGPVMHNYCQRQGLQPSDANDVAQETLKAVAAAIKNFDYDPSKGAFHAWLLTFLRHRLQRFYRQRDRLPTPVGSRVLDALDSAQQYPEDDAAAWENEVRKAAFESACQQVRPTVQQNTWTAFWNTAVRQLPPEQVAAELEISVGAVYIAKSRVLARLRTAVEQLTDQSQVLELAAS